MSRGHEYLFYIFNDNEGCQWNSKKYSFYNEYLWNIAVYCKRIIKIHHVWDRIFNIKN